MRKKFVYFIFIPLLVLVAVLYFFLDGWVESGLELAGESAVGAKVEIDNLRLALSPVGMEFARLQVANPRDPWKNTFETGKVGFAIDFGQLLRGKFIIETMEVNNLILATKRTTDGSLPGKAQEKRPEQQVQQQAGRGTAVQPSLTQEASALTEQKKKATPVFDLDKLRKQLNIDSLLAVKNLRSAQHIDSLKVQIAQADRQWDATLKDVEQSKEKINQIETSIKAINLSELKSLESITKALKNANDAQKAIKEVSETFRARKSAVTDEINRLNASVRMIDDLVKEDYQGLLDLARLPDMNMKGLAELLLGKEIFDQANEYLSWVEFAQKNIKNLSSNPDKDASSRTGGQDIHFPEERAYPKFWIKRVLVSGGTDKEQNSNYFYAKGEIRDVSADQRITHKPIVVDLSATQGRGTKATIAASFDRTTDTPLDKYEATMTGIPVASMPLGKSDFVPSKITNALAGFSLQVLVPSTRFEAKARIAMTNVRVAFDQAPRNTVERIVQDVLHSISAFTVALRFWKAGGGLSVAMETDLDNQLVERTKRVLGEEVNRLRNELKAKLDRKIAGKRQEVERLLGQKKDAVQNQLKTYESQVNEKASLVEKKKTELEQKIEGEKKKAGEGLKNLLRKKKN